MDEPRSSNSDGWAMVSGAALGSLAFYLLQTPKGRRLCDSFIRALDEFSSDCRRFSQAASRAQVAAADAWHALDIPRRSD